MGRKKLNILWPHTKSRSQTFNLDNACLSNNWEGGGGNKITILLTKVPPKKSLCDV